MRTEGKKWGGFWLSPENAQRLMDERDAALAREAAIIQFCEEEMGREFFRAEFKIGDNPSKSLENAKRLLEFLSAHTSTSRTPASDKDPSAIPPERTVRDRDLVDSPRGARKASRKTTQPNKGQ
jgi:hypothetical protein